MPPKNQYSDYPPHQNDDGGKTLEGVEGLWKIILHRRHQYKARGSLQRCPGFLFVELIAVIVHRLMRQSQKGNPGGRGRGVVRWYAN